MKFLLAILFLIIRCIIACKYATEQTFFNVFVVHTLFDLRTSCPLSPELPPCSCLSSSCVKVTVGRVGRHPAPSPCRVIAASSRRGLLRAGHLVNNCPVRSRLHPHAIQSRRLLITPHYGGVQRAVSPRPAVGDQAARCNCLSGSGRPADPNGHCGRPTALNGCRGRAAAHSLVVVY